ncbi:MAG: hypothetical protein ACRCYR_13890 [Phycicoccus sp.]
MSRDLEKAFDELRRAVDREVAPPSVHDLLARARTDVDDRPTAGPDGPARRARVTGGTDAPGRRARPEASSTSSGRRRGAFVLGGLAAAAALVGPTVAVLLPAMQERSDTAPATSGPVVGEPPATPSGWGGSVTGPGPSPGTTPTAPEPTEQVSPAPSATADRTVQVTVSVLSRATGAAGCSRLVDVTRSVPADDPVRGAVLATLAGVTADERARGLWSVWGEGGRPTPVEVQVDHRRTSVRIDLRTLRDDDGASWKTTFLVGGSVDAQRAYVDRGGPATP